MCMYTHTDRYENAPTYIDVTYTKATGDALDTQSHQNVWHCYVAFSYWSSRLLRCDAVITGAMNRTFIFLSRLVQIC